MLDTASPAAAPASPTRETAVRILERIARAGLYLFAATVPISIALMQIGLWSSALALAALVALGMRPRLRSPLDVPVLVLCGAAVLSQVLAFSWAGGFVNVILWRSFLTPLIILAVLSLAPERARADALRLLAVWAVAALVPTAIGWVQTFAGIDPLHELGLREKALRAHVKMYPGRFAAMGFFRWYQRLAQNLAPPLLLATALLLLGRAWPRRRPILGAALVAITSVVVITFTRSAWYGLVAGGGVIAVLAGPRRAAIALAIGGVVAALVVAFEPGVRARIATTFSAQGNTDRVQIWGVCKVLREQKPVFGWGFGNLPVAARDQWWKLYPVGTVRAWCHNQFFTSLVEGGVLLLGATLLYFAGIGAAFLRWWRRTDAAGKAACAGALAGLTFMLVNALVHDVFYASEPMYGFGFALGLAAVLARSGETAS